MSCILKWFIFSVINLLSLIYISVVYSWYICELQSDLLNYQNIKQAIQTFQEKEKKIQLII